ncbi:glycosyltransferase family 2 protein [Phosphitispora sp. TUW77]|uniref:glycosyltransferase family 2 protein n=1 Tax=Phosphitispora sp. TUW77 TaxID=3152361 RepID=UPI003AB71ECA
MIYSFIIVNYNTKRITADCIQSLIDNKHLKYIEHEIIVVDNASKDGSQEFIEANFPQVMLIKNKENLGFGKANNIGSKAANGKYLIFINSDTIAYETDFYSLLDISEANSQMGFLSCKILNEDGSIQSIGYNFPSLMNEIKLRLLLWNFKFIKKIRLNNYDDKGIFEVDWLSGSFMICDKSLFELLGGFDKDIFMYSEDLDICYRAYSAGKINLIYDRTSIYHLHGKSGNKKNPSFKQLINRKENYFYVIKKNRIVKFMFLIKTLTYINVIIVYIGKRILTIVKTLQNNSETTGS